MISIIVPFYNTEKYIEQCLSSIKAQTFSDYECLMIDDGSTDSSRQIAQQFADEDSRFILLNKEHIGFPQAKNLGLDNAKGEYICFIDSDDFVYNNYLELLHKAMKEHDVDFVSCSIIYTHNEYSPQFFQRPYECIVYKENIVSKMFSSCGTSFLWNKLYKKELFNNLRCENVISLSDTLMSPILYHRAKSIALISPILICHRYHDENMSYIMRHSTPEYWEHRINVYIKICNFLLETHPEIETLVKLTFRHEFDFFGINEPNKKLVKEYKTKEIVQKLLSKPSKPSNL